MTFRKTLTTLLCSALLMLICSCNPQDVAPTASITDPAASSEVILQQPEGTIVCLLPESAPTADAATEPPVLSQLPSAENWVTAAISRKYAWDDGVGNRNEVTVCLPHINSGSKFAADYNADIDAFADRLNTEIDELASSGCSTHIVSVNYEAWVNGDLLSILITTKTCIDYIEYRIDNFDLEDKEAMSVADMCDEYLDLEYPQFLKYTRGKIMQDFGTEYADFITQFPEDYDFMKDLYLQDVSIPLNYRLYLGETGALMLVCDRPAIAGGASYSSIGEMTVDPVLIPSEAEAWSWLFDLYLSADQENTEYAAQILRIAYEEDDDDFTEHLRQRPRNERDAIMAILRVKENKEG